MDLLSGDPLNHLLSYIPESYLLILASTCKKYRRLVFSLPLYSKITVNTDKNSQRDPLRLQNIISLFPNAETMRAIGKTTQTWVQNLPLDLKFQALIIQCPIHDQFLNVLRYCSQLTELRIYNMPSKNISSLFPYIPQLSNLKILQLPETVEIENPQLVSQILTQCNLTLLELRYSTRQDLHFWESVVKGTPPEKLKILKTLQVLCYGSVAFDDSDSDISEIFHYFPDLFRFSFKGSLEYECLENILSENTEIRDLILPWPQKDYTEKMEKFLSKYHKKLYGIQVQSRNDNLLKLIHEHHGPGLTSLHLACTEGVTTEGLVNLLSRCPSLEYLSLFFYDGHTWDSNLGETIRNIPELNQLWLGCLSTTVIAENIFHIEHPKISKLDLRELRVHFLEVICPNVKEILPPIFISNEQNAHEIYQICYPNSFAVRVAERDNHNLIFVSPLDTVDILKKKIKEELNKDFVMSVIVGGKSLKDSQICGECLKNGSQVKLLC